MAAFRGYLLVASGFVGVLYSLFPTQILILTPFPPSWLERILRVYSYSCCLLFRLLGNKQIGILDESFEKEVWYDGEEPAVYMTIDVWHPDLSEADRLKL